jgi:hypothetical protein
MNCLHLAAFRGRSAVVRAILDLGGVDIDSIGLYSFEHRLCRGRALVFSLHGGGDEFPPRFSCPDAALALLEAGANPNILEGEWWCTVLHYCVFRRDGIGTDQQHLAVMAAALQNLNGAQLDVYASSDDHDDMQPLHAAVYSGFYEAAKLLIQAGAQINFDLNDVTVPPLSLAPHGGSIETFRLLLEHGADINGLDENSFNFLHYCVGHGWGLPLLLATIPARKEMLRVALELSVDVAHAGRVDNLSGSDLFGELKGLTPLHTASVYGASWAIAPLMMAGSDINARDVAGHTPIIIACGNCVSDRLLAVRDPCPAGEWWRCERPPGES